jgi:hypothetical protein
MEYHETLKLHRCPKKNRGETLKLQKCVVNQKQTAALREEFPVDR